jgi:4-amino-4-deoxy-L-arabinose transferase-like glycosyltransferase
LISAPWWTAVSIQTHGEWPSAFLLGHNISRFLTPFEEHNAFVGMAVLFLLIALLPLTRYLFKALVPAWKERLTRPMILLSLTAVGSVVVFFSLSSTLLPNYIGPAVPFGAILIGYGVERQLKILEISKRSLRISASIAFAIAVAFPIVLHKAISSDRWISDLPQLAWLFIPLPIGAAVALVYAIRNQLWQSLLSYLLSLWLVGVLFFYVGVPQIMARNPVVNSSQMILESGREVLGYYFFNSAYVFAMQRTLPTFYTPEAIRAYSVGKRVIVVTRKDYEAQLTAVGFRVIFEKPYLFESSVALVMVNDP